MTNKKFDSEAFLERLTLFGQRCQKLVSKLPKTQYNFEYSGQLIRSSSSPAANYIEALEALGSKDFIHKLRISRKETRESTYWLRMILSANSEISESQKDAQGLIDEGRNIIKLLTSSILTLEKKNL